MRGTRTRKPLVVEDLRTLSPKGQLHKSEMDVERGTRNTAAQACTRQANRANARGAQARAGRGAEGETVNSHQENARPAQAGAHARSRHGQGSEEGRGKKAKRRHTALFFASLTCSVNRKRKPLPSGCGKGNCGKCVEHEPVSLWQKRTSEPWDSKGNHTSLR